MRQSIRWRNFWTHWSIRAVMIDVSDHFSIKIVSEICFDCIERWWSFCAIVEACNVTMTIHINTISAINEVNMVRHLHQWEKTLIYSNHLNTDHASLSLSRVRLRITTPTWFSVSLGTILDWTIRELIGQRNHHRLLCTTLWLIGSGYRIHSFGTPRKANAVISPYPTDWFVSIAMAKYSTVKGNFLPFESCSIRTAFAHLS